MRALHDEMHACLRHALAYLERWLGAAGVTDPAGLARLKADDGALSKVILRHPGGLLVGLTRHRGNDSAPFDESRTGFDHVALIVADRDELASWEARLDERGITRSPIETTPLGALITIRDPDNTRLELYAPAT